MEDPGEGEEKSGKGVSKATSQIFIECATAGFYLSASASLHAGDAPLHELFCFTLISALYSFLLVDLHVRDVPLLEGSSVSP